MLDHVLEGHRLPITYLGWALRREGLERTVTSSVACTRVNVCNDKKECTQHLRIIRYMALRHTMVLQTGIFI